MEKPEDTIKNICGNVEERIRSCRSRNVAEMLREQLCSQLKINCKSEIVQNSLNDHVDRLIAQTFDKQGHNRILNGESQ
jgi:hypothetical protein